MTYIEMERLARHPKVIAWGEIGLDYYYDHSPRDTQQEVFIRQMELAGAAKLPIVIHCRPSDGSENAWDDCLSLFSEQWAPKGIGGILHCFTGDSPRRTRAGYGIHDLFRRKCHLSQGTADSRRRIEVPLDRILIETDCPYLAPVPTSGQTQRAGIRGGNGPQVGRIAGSSTEDRGADRPQFLQFFQIL